MNRNCSKRNSYSYGDRDYSRVLTADYFASLLMAYCMLLVSLSAYSNNLKMLTFSIILSGLVAAFPFTVIGCTALIKGHNVSGRLYLLFASSFMAIFLIALMSGYFMELESIREAIVLVLFAGMPSIIMAVKGGYSERIWRS